MQVLKQFYDIEKRVKVIAEQVSLDCKEISKEATPVFICILNGGAIFYHDLLANLKVDCITEYMKVKSYKGKQSGEIDFLLDIQSDIKGKPVYIIDDIIDTGATMGHILANLVKQQPLFMKTVTLVERKAPAFKADFCCFRDMGDDWFVGYGFDKDGKCRNYRSLYTDGKIDKTISPEQLENLK